MPKKRELKPSEKKKGRKKRRGYKEDSVLLHYWVFLWSSSSSGITERANFALFSFKSRFFVRTDGEIEKRKRERNELIAAVFEEEEEEEEEGNEVAEM